MKTVLFASLLLAAGAVQAGSSQPLPTTTPDYPIVCADAAGSPLLVVDGKKVRVAHWDGHTPYFTDSKVTSRHKRTFPAPKGSVCRFATDAVAAQ